MADDVLNQIMESQRTMATEITAIGTTVEITGRHTAEALKEQKNINDALFHHQRKTDKTLFQWKGALAVLGLVWAGLQAWLVRKVW